jgi:hypothetical protein
VNDHLQLLIQSRCLAQWWPQQNPDIQRIQTNTAVMMEEIASMQTQAHQHRHGTTLDVPMLTL